MSELPVTPTPDPIAPPRAADPSRRPSLWRHSGYLKLWSAATISLMGTAVTQIALPYIAAVILQATPLEVALLGMVDMLPFLLFALPAGALLDRVRRRPVLVAGDFGRALVLGTIPLAYALGTLTIWQLYAVGFTAGLLTVLFDVADQSFLPVLLEPEDLVDGNAKLQISTSAAQIVGPGLGGGIIALVAAPFAILLDAISYLASGSLIALIRGVEPKPPRPESTDRARPGLRAEMAEGLHYVLGHPHLRMIAGCTGTSNLGSAVLFAIFPLFVYRELGLSPALVGLAFGLGSFGFLGGALVAAPLARRLGLGRTIVASIFLGGPSMFLMALMPAEPLLAGILLLASQVLVGFSQVVYNVNQVSFRQAITPLSMQGRMNATMRFIVWGTMPIGSILGGVLATYLPLRTTVVIGGLIASSAVLWVLLSPVRSLGKAPARLPES